jgi:hypothetical protein
MNKIASKIKIALPKIGKKNIIILCAIVMICGAIYLNWMLFSNNDITPVNIDEPDSFNDNTIGQASYVDSTPKIEDDSYFTISQLNRQRARDEAMEVLYSILDSTDALQELKDKAVEDINRIASTIEKEANVETLVMAKGFEECVAVLSREAANIVVKTSGLMPNEVIQIKEIVYEQAGILPSNVKIVEKIS